MKDDIILTPLVENMKAFRPKLAKYLPYIQKIYDVKIFKTDQIYMKSSGYKINELLQIC